MADQLGGLTSSVVEYVNSYIFINKDTYSIILAYINNFVFITYIKNKIATLK
jgi:hypothetical protein